MQKNKLPQIKGVKNMKKINSKKIIFSAFVVLIVLIVGVLVFTNLSNKEKKNIQTDVSPITGDIVLTNPSNEETIEIGAILPLTGTTAFAGEALKNGALLAVDEINAKGGIDGKMVKLIIEDSKSAPAEGVNAFNNLELKKPDVVISAMASVSAAVIPIANTTETPIIAPVATSPQLITEYDNAYRYFPTAKQEIPPIIEIANEKGIKKMGIIYLNDEFGAAMFSTLTEEFDGEVIGESFLISNTDYSTSILKLKEAKVDRILVVGFSSHISKCIQQIKEYNLDVVIFAPSTSAFPDIRNTLGSEEIYAGIPSFYNTESSNPATKFKEDYKAKYGKDADHYAATGYDTVMLIKKAIEEGSANREGIINGLNKIKVYSGIFGDVTKDGREFGFNLYPAEVSKEKISFE
jgi:branched-chain amino acid transport system substrate-binding protein